MIDKELLEPIRELACGYTFEQIRDAVAEVEKTHAKREAIRLAQTNLNAWRVIEKELCDAKDGLPLDLREKSKHAFDLMGDSIRLVRKIVEKYLAELGA
jgi:hypothetical protein